MFGFKIISKSVYDHLLECKYKCQDLQMEVNDLKHERKALMKELEHAYLTKTEKPENGKPSDKQPQTRRPLEGVTDCQQTEGGYRVIRHSGRRCEDCPDETDTCKKLYIKKGTICVEPSPETIKFD